MTTTYAVQGSREDSVITLETLPQSQQSNVVVSAAAPSDTFPVVEKWNDPRINIYRTFSTFWCFLVMGAVRLFLSTLVGYTATAFLNHRIHYTLGQRGVAIIGPACHLVAYVVNCVHPQYPIGNTANANELLGVLYGIYGAGAVVACAVIELVLSGACFWKSTAEDFRASNTASVGSDNEGGLRDALFTRPTARVTWLCALFLLGYAGVEVALGGWIVTFMIRVRQGSAFASGMTATGFWLGITVGRIILGFVNPRVGEKIAIATYIVASMAFGLVL
ncbi:Major facilitator superfamily domain general substrate transporter [Penicillium bovifimosum]|uniref:Major facilitator superfamily domain general substrate transporter n=1 Tax=Penicillium bovifimosum TaxID=126998 RepID=A0A9W9L9V5_9EURO|nr:Major facilitator superfamily domain general substrate transporter [Penicillium bovifimosum]KAJ5144258.1 Major facilitator superfamily domain general substrate transporter [Penicillium bovifimosum]